MKLNNKFIAFALFLSSCVNNFALKNANSFKSTALNMKDATEEVIPSDEGTSPTQRFTRRSIESSTKLNASPLIFVATQKIPFGDKASEPSLNIVFSSRPVNSLHALWINFSLSEKNLSGLAGWDYDGRNVFMQVSGGRGGVNKVAFVDSSLLSKKRSICFSRFIFKAKNKISAEIALATYLAKNETTDSKMSRRLGLVSIINASVNNKMDMIAGASGLMMPYSEEAKRLLLTACYRINIKDILYGTGNGMSVPFVVTASVTNVISSMKAHINSVKLSNCSSFTISSAIGKTSKNGLSIQTSFIILGKYFGGYTYEGSNTLPFEEGKEFIFSKKRPSSMSTKLKVDDKTIDILPAATVFVSEIAVYASLSPIEKIISTSIMSSVEPQIVLYLKITNYKQKIDDIALGYQISSNNVNGGDIVVKSGIDSAISYDLGLSLMLSIS